MPEHVDPAIWDELVMRRALAARDVSTVYRLLVTAGVHQRVIAKATGQSQSEVSEILAGRRVFSYEVLVRVAAGFGIPRGWMGLAYTDAEGRVITYSGDEADEGDSDSMEDDEMVSRRVLGMASAALLGEAALDRPIMQLGASLLGDPRGVPLLEGSSDSLGTLNKRDVPWVRAITDHLWELDLQYGGASIFSAASGTAIQVVGALRNSPPNRELLLAASHLCRVTGWTAFDAGRKRTFWKYHATALDLAREANDMKTVIQMVNVAGRAEILSGNHRAAAKLFELVSFRTSPDAVGWGLLGSAYAPNSPESAKGALLRLRDAEGADTLDATAMLGHVSHDIGDYPTAITAFSEVVPRRSGRVALQETAPLAIAYLRAGEGSMGLHHAENALTLSENLRSSKCTDVLRPLGDMLATQQDSTAQDLARKITTVLTGSPTARR